MATKCSKLLITGLKKRDFQERQKHERQLRLGEIREKIYPGYSHRGLKGTN